MGTDNVPALRAGAVTEAPRHVQAIRRAVSGESEATRKSARNLERVYGQCVCPFQSTPTATAGAGAAALGQELVCPDAVCDASATHVAHGPRRRRRYMHERGAWTADAPRSGTTDQMLRIAESGMDLGARSF